MRRPGVATILATVVLAATVGCTRGDPTPHPRDPVAGDVTEVVPDGIRPPSIDPKVPFDIQEPIALLPVTPGGDVDVIDAPPRNFLAAIWRLRGQSQGKISVVVPAELADLGLQAEAIAEVSSAARSEDGATWLMDNPSHARNGVPRLTRIPPGGQASVHSMLSGLQLSRDRVRLISLPNGQVGYLAGGRVHALAGDNHPVPALHGVERLVPAGDGGYLAALRREPGTALEVVRVDSAGSRRTFAVPAEVRRDPIRPDSQGGALVPTFTGAVVGLTPDGHDGAFIAIAAKPLDDALGVDIYSSSMLLHLSADGTTTLLMTGRRTGRANCPTLRRPTGIPDAERDLGRVTDLLVRGDQVWIADAACRRVLALQLRAT